MKQECVTGMRDSCVFGVARWAFVCVCLAGDHTLVKWTRHSCGYIPDININMCESRLPRPLVALSRGHPQSCVHETRTLERARVPVPTL